MFLVLGAVTVVGPDRQVVALSDRQRALLASLLARAGAVVSVDSLVDLVWPEDPPQDPVAALHNQVSRLRRALPFTAIETVPPGYRLAVGPDDVDSQRFDRLVRADTTGSLGEALSLWHGAAYAEFAESPVARFEAIRLEEARRQATERWHERRLDQGSADLAALEAFATEHPLRERAHLIWMRALYASGRQADALAAYQRYAGRLADELGLEPSAALQELQLRVLRHTVAPPAPLRAMQVSHVSVGDRRIAVATVGSGPPLIALPGWVSNIDVIAAGRDPRSSIFQRLTGTRALVMYDRYGTGRSGGPVDDFGLDASVAELAAVATCAGAPVDLLAMSQAGPVAVALAATRPELVRRLVFFGTYASAAEVFTRPDLSASLIALVRSHWGLGSKLLADLYRPDLSDAAADHMAAVLRDSADRDVAAGYLEAIYATDATALLPAVRAPALVLHYQGDRVIPHRGGLQLAEGLPDARLVTLKGRYHLPDIRDLDHIVGTITAFLSGPDERHP
jgi:DNA-binding SARP family transcriptional activator/pimeloyl-ACP methyl ester carboxylesterase